MLDASSNRLIATEQESCARESVLIVSEISAISPKVDETVLLNCRLC